MVFEDKHSNIQVQGSSTKIFNMIGSNFKHDVHKHWEIKCKFAGENAKNILKKAFINGRKLEITVIDAFKGIKILVHDAIPYSFHHTSGTTIISTIVMEAEEIYCFHDDSTIPVKVLLT